MNPPFKTKGIYARKLNPKKELNNYKPTKLGSLWKAAIGEKEEAFYEIIWFSENYSFNQNDLEEKKYCADYTNMNGEIFDLVDWHKGRGCFYSEYKDVIFNDYSFEFGDNDVSYTGSIHDDILYLKITDKETGDSISEKLRYLPWI